MSANEGISQSGGSIQVGGSLAVGRGAHAESVVDHPTLDATTADALRDELETIRAAVETARGSLPDADAAVAQVEALHAEVSAGPQPHRFGAAVEALNGALGPLAALTTGLVGVARAAGLMP